MPGPASGRAPLRQAVVADRYKHIGIFFGWTEEQFFLCATQEGQGGQEQKCAVQGGAGTPGQNNAILGISSERKLCKLIFKWHFFGILVFVWLS